MSPYQYFISGNDAVFNKLQTVGQFNQIIWGSVSEASG